jgi:DNA replication protein DnaC
MIERMLYRLDQRIDSQIKKTIITSNLSLEEIEKKEERLFSRMCQDATIVVIT